MPDEVAVTLKAGAGYDEPWITIRSETVEGVVGHINDLIENNVAVLVGEAALDLTSKSAAVRGVGARPIVNGPATQGVVHTPSPTVVPAAASSTGLETKTDNFGNVYTFGIPGAPTCPHGPRTQKQGKNKSDQPYTAWVCSVPARDYKNKTDCKPEYVR